MLSQHSFSRCVLVINNMSRVLKPATNEVIKGIFVVVNKPDNPVGSNDSMTSSENSSPESNLMDKKENNDDEKETVEPTLTEVVTKLGEEATEEEEVDAEEAVNFKFPRKKVEAAKFLVAARLKYAKVIKGLPYAEETDYETVVNDNLWREMSDSYKNMLPYIMMHHRKLESASIKSPSESSNLSSPPPTPPINHSSSKSPSPSTSPKAAGNEKKRMHESTLKKNSIKVVRSKFNPPEDEDASESEENSEKSNDDDLTINNNGVRRVEVENKHMLNVYKHCYRFFKNNMDNRSGGYAKFPYHLLSYLFHRSLSRLRGKYNPTSKCDTDLFKYMGKEGNPLHHFCCTLMELSEEEYVTLMRKGNTMHFKRALKPVMKLGGIVQPCDAYLKLKNTLKITGW